MTSSDANMHTAKSSDSYACLKNCVVGSPLSRKVWPEVVTIAGLVKYAMISSTDFGDSGNFAEYFLVKVRIRFFGPRPSLTALNQKIVHHAK